MLVFVYFLLEKGGGGVGDMVLSDTKTPVGCGGEARGGGGGGY